MTNPSKYMTPQELAEYLGLAVGTVFSMTSRGQIPVTRLGKRLPRYRVGDIESWLKERTKIPSASA